MMTAEQINVAVTDHLPLIVKLARQEWPKFRGKVNFHDLVSFGAEGAAQALRRYDETKCKMTTFIYKRIKGAMYDGMRTQGEARYIRDRRKITDQIEGELFQRLGRKPSEDEIMAEVTKRGYRWQLTPFNRARMVSRIDWVAKYRADNQAENPYKSAELKDTYEFLTRHLSREDKLIAHLRINEGCTLPEIGKIIGLTEMGAAFRWAKIKAVLIERLKQVA